MRFVILDLIIESLGMRINRLSGVPQFTESRSTKKHLAPCAAYADRIADGDGMFADHKNPGHQRGGDVCEAKPRAPSEYRQRRGTGLVERLALDRASVVQAQGGELTYNSTPWALEVKGRGRWTINASRRDSC